MQTQGNRKQASIIEIMHISGNVDMMAVQVFCIHWIEVKEFEWSHKGHYIAVWFKVLMLQHKKKKKKENPLPFPEAFLLPSETGFR